MKIKLWGTRGSIPTPGPETTHFGGNTACVSVQVDDKLLILDAGSGIRRLGKDLTDVSRIDILLTHLHLDHIQGLGFFRPLYDPNSEIHIWGAGSENQHLKARLARYLSPPLFPVRIRDFSSELIIHEINRGEFHIGEIKITSDYVCHPSPTLGYRIEAQGKVFTYISDHDPGFGDLGKLKDPAWTSGYSLAEHADLLIHDAQFTPEEYERNTGWGHSSYELAINFAEMCQAKKLLLFHHDPARTDQELSDMYQTHIQHKGYPFPIKFAVEGEEFEL